MKPTFPHLSSPAIKSCNPLRILFCSSDHFGLDSLLALCREHRRNPHEIASIDVVCRPPKCSGRGLKEFKKSALITAAEKLDLPLYQIDTFTGWSPPESINLIIAVSFGLLVPPRLLRAATYGGLNVHPSLLPKYPSLLPSRPPSICTSLLTFSFSTDSFPGPAPIHHTLLSPHPHNKTTGLTLQTLHPTKFDTGTILAQLPLPILSPETCTPAILSQYLAPHAADLLVKGLSARVFIPPYDPINLIVPKDSQIRLAPKITTEDTHVDWTTWTCEEILRRYRVLGRLWNFAQCHDKGKLVQRRVFWEDGLGIYESGDNNDAMLEEERAVEEGRKVGVPYALRVGGLVIPCKDGTIEVMRARAEGRSPGVAVNVVLRMGAARRDSEGRMRFWEELG